MTTIKVPPRPPAPKPKKRPWLGPAFKTFDYYTLDFETEGIQRRPNYPPKPVSYSLTRPGQTKPEFWAWGHPEGNNVSREHAREKLADVWGSGLPVLCQHAKFDLDVAEEHMELPMLPWERAHDTLYLLFLHNPHAGSLSLKPSAQEILGMAPTEQGTLKEWILTHIPAARHKPSEWGAYISQAPAQIVGPYARGDVIRTKRLFDKLLKEIYARNMVAAYNRERRLMPILLENERIGIRCDIDRLEHDFPMYCAALEKADNWIRKRLKAPDLNMDADKDVGEALDKVGAVTEWTWTPGGKNKASQRSVSKKNLLLSHFRDRKLAMVWAYRNRLRTCLSMFMTHWLEWGRAGGGFLNTNWNQVRQPGERKGLKGTRTGRPSSEEPNFLNISKNFEEKDDGFVFEEWMETLFPELPLMRDYLLPDVGEVWIHRDFNQQELRMLAHYEDGKLKDHYCERPHRNKDLSMRFDIHSSVQAGLLEIASLSLSRSGTKILNFSDVYGKGLANLAESLGLDLPTTQLVRNAKNEMMPGVPKLIERITTRSKAGEPIRTWDGREYYVEPAKYVKKYDRVMDFHYKLLNYLIQGSSAGVTKEAVIRHHEHPKRQGRFLVTVYDEINMSGARGRLDVEMKALREAMESIETDVPMLSDGKTGPSWGKISSYKGPAERYEWNALEAGERWWAAEDSAALPAMAAE